jgi:hypothetical protein
VLQVDGDDLGKGVLAGLGTPRYSTAYGDARHLPSVLLEAHSLKPYRQRVLGTYVLVESALRLLAREGAALRQAIAADRARRAGEVTLDWKAREGAPQAVPFAGIEYRVTPSPVSGGKRVTWSGRKATLQVPVVRADAPAARAAAARVLDPAGLAGGDRAARKRTASAWSASRSRARWTSRPTGWRTRSWRPRRSRATCA